MHSIIPTRATVSSSFQLPQLHSSHGIAEFRPDSADVCLFTSRESEKGKKCKGPRLTASRPILKIWPSCPAACNYKSFTCYSKQLHQQANGICFWLSGQRPIYESPERPSSRTEEAEPRGAATNRKCTSAQLYSDARIPAKLQFRPMAAGLWRGNNWSARQSFLLGVISQKNLISASD